MACRGGAAARGHQRGVVGPPQAPRAVDWGHGEAYNHCLLLDYSTLEPGQVVSRRTLTIDQETVSSYVTAVADASRPWGEEAADKTVPPTAVATLGFRCIIEDLTIPEGTVHAGQELEFGRPTRVGESLTYEATIEQNSVRRGSRFVTVGMAVQDSIGRKVMAGKSLLMVPAG